MAVAAKEAKPVSQAGEVERTKVRTPWNDAWTQFKRNRLAVVSLIYIICLIIVAITADFWRSVGFIDDPTFMHRGTATVKMARADVMTCTIDARRMDPQWCFAIGTDGAGRDNLSRLVYGAQISLAIAAVGSTVSFIIGILYGVIAGFYGGRIDNWMMRIIDLMYSVPELPIIIMMKVFFDSLADYRDQVGPFGQAMVDIDKNMGGMFFLYIVIGLLGWIGMARLARGQVLSFKNKDFIEAARAIGARNRHIITSHLLPNIIGPMIVVQCMAIPGYIAAEASLSFLGLGVRAPTPSWGQMIADAYNAGVQSKPWVVLAPATALAATVLAFNFLGDGLRDAFDPRLRGE